MGEVYRATDTKLRREVELERGISAAGMRRQQVMEPERKKPAALSGRLAIFFKPRSRSLLKEAGGPVPVVLWLMPETRCQ